MPGGGEGGRGQAVSHPSVLGTSPSAKCKTTAHCMCDMFAPCNIVKYILLGTPDAYFFTGITRVIGLA